VPAVTGIGELVTLEEVAAGFFHQRSFISRTFLKLLRIIEFT
jgi:hypothetical protein